MHRSARTHASRSRRLRSLVATTGLASLLLASACKKESSTPPEPDADPTVEFDKPPIPPLDERVGKAQKMVADGAYQEALDLLDEALVDEPDLADLHYGRGLTLSFMERDDEALAAYDRALELDEALVPALVARGNMFAFALGELERARTDYDAAIAAAPEYGPGYHGRGTIRLDGGDVPGAVEDLTKAAEFDPKNANTLYVLAQAHAAAGDAAAALAAAERAVELEPDVSGADLRLLQAKLRLANGDAPGSIDAYEALAALVPDAPELRLAVGRGILQAGAPDKALPHFEAVAQAVPDQPAPLVNWARALAASGDTEDALAKLDAALELDAKLPAAHVYKIEILSAAKSCADAQKALGRFEKAGAEGEALARAQAAVDACGG